MVSPIVFPESNGLSTTTHLNRSDFYNPNAQRLLSAYHPENRFWTRVRGGETLGSKDLHDMAGYEMAGADLFECRFLVFAYALLADASRIKPATGWRVDRRGDLPS